MDANSEGSSRTSIPSGLAAVAAGFLAVSGMANAASAAEPVSTQAAPTPAGHEAVALSSVAVARVKVHNVQGRFSYTQDLITTTEALSRDMTGVSSILHGDAHAASNQDPALADAWQVEVCGLVGLPMLTTMSALGQRFSRKRVMSYTCSENPADGRATANVEITGVPLRDILDQADVSRDANAVRFVSTDRYSVDLPLDYVRSHDTYLVNEVNGQRLVDVTGAANQLWVGATSAHWYVRDVNRIELLQVGADRMPVTPGSPADTEPYANRPNVGALRGWSA